MFFSFSWGGLDYVIVEIFDIRTMMFFDGYFLKDLRVYLNRGCGEVGFCVCVGMCVCVFLRERKKLVKRRDIS